MPKSRGFRLSQLLAASAIAVFASLGCGSSDSTRPPSTTSAASATTNAATAAATTSPDPTSAPSESGGTTEEYQQRVEKFLNSNTAAFGDGWSPGIVKCEATDYAGTSCAFDMGRYADDGSHADCTATIRLDDQAASGKLLPVITQRLGNSGDVPSDLSSQYSSVDDYCDAMFSTARSALSN